MTEFEVSEVEAALDLTLPEAYKRFLLHYPQALLEPGYDAALVELLNSPKPLIELNRLVRRAAEIDWPEGYFVIGESRCGDYCAIDLGDDDSPVFFWNHELQDFSDEVEAESLTQFAGKLLNVYRTVRGEYVPADPVTVERQLEELGWKSLAPRRYLGEEFDLVGTRQFLISQWSVLVRYVDVLDDEELQRCAASLLHLCAAAKRTERFFLLCLVAGNVEIDPEYVAEAGDSFGLFGVLGLLEGGGNVLVVDLEDRTVFGTVPTLPYATRRFSRDLKLMFEEILAGE